MTNLKKLVLITTALAASPAVFAGWSSSVAVDVGIIKVQVEGDFAAVYIDRNIINPGSCTASSDESGFPVKVVFDGTTSAGKNTLATLLAAKNSGAKVKLNVFDDKCIYNLRAIQGVSVL